MIKKIFHGKNKRPDRNIILVSDKEKSLRLKLLLAWVALSCFVIWAVRPLYISSLLIVIAPPSLLNFLWLKNSRRNVLLFSLLATFLFAPAVELSARLTDIWDVQTVFFRPFGLIPLENMLFAFFNFFWVLSFYEYFVDRDKKTAISKKLRYLVLLFIFFSAAIFALFFIDKRLIQLNYLALSVPILIIPSVLIFSKNIHLIKKTILPTVFFATVLFIYEMVAMDIGNWWWPGTYLYTVLIAGHIFPLDDVIVWYLLSTPGLIGGYEFFSDDYR